MVTVHPPVPLSFRWTMNEPSIWVIFFYFMKINIQIHHVLSWLPFETEIYFQNMVGIVWHNQFLLSLYTWKKQVCAWCFAHMKSTIAVHLCHRSAYAVTSEIFSSKSISTCLLYYRAFWTILIVPDIFTNQTDISFVCANLKKNITLQHAEPFTEF